MQKRLLNDSMLMLHKKFKQEYANIKISYTTFTRLRPFWVVIPTQKDRDTCMCKTCENLQMLLEVGDNHGLITLDSLNTVPEQVTCSPSSKDCSYNECKSCKKKQILVPNATNENVMSIHQWTRKTETKEKFDFDSGKYFEFKVKRTIKEEKILTPAEFIEMLNQQSTLFAKHQFNILHQYKMFNHLKKNLKNNECIIQIDFSENFKLGHGKEIQSAHSGSSQAQVSLHTGVFHVKTSSELEVFSFCTISPNTQHGPPAIWVHMEPIFSLLTTKFPSIKHLHFYSDGPATQYRQKGNFYLLSTVLFNKGFLSGTWNFWEAGHGRGAPDGVGGAIKRRADQLLKHGTDLPTAEIMFKKLNETTDSKINIFFIPADRIETAYQDQPELKPIPKTNRIHQVITTVRGTVQYRDISCFCTYTGVYCKCYNMKEFTFQEQQTLLNDYQADCTEEDNVNNPIFKASFISKAFVKPQQNNIEQLLGQWVIVKFDDHFYPGIVKSISNSKNIFVSCLQQTNRTVNKYFWPKKEDLLSYTLNEIITIITVPNVFESGHLEIPSIYWNDLCKLFNL